MRRFGSKPTSYCKNFPAISYSFFACFQDLGNKVCTKTGSQCTGQCHATHSNGNIQPVGDNVFSMGNWYRPESLEQLADILKSFHDGSIKYRLVSGNTGIGK